MGVSPSIYPCEWCEAHRSVCGDDFRIPFADAYFDFSHYGKANEVTPMQDLSAWTLWLRGTAILCQLDQELTDRAIPIFFSSLGPVSPKSVSLALEQDKTGQSADPRMTGIQSAETLDLFTQGNKLPYIAFVHCYGLTSNEGISVSTASPHHLRYPDQDEEAPRYQINFRGLSACRDVTVPIGVEIQKIIDDSKNTLFKHHLRTYGLSSLRQMFSVLSRDLDTTLWFAGLRTGEVSSQVVGGAGRRSSVRLKWM